MNICPCVSLTDVLTADELAQLLHKIYSGSHKLAEVSHAFGGVALTRPLTGPDRDWLFALRQPYVDAMYDAHALAEDVKAGHI